MNELINKHQIKIQLGVLALALIFLVTTVWAIAEAKNNFVTYNSKYIADIEDRITTLFHNVEKLKLDGQGRDLVLVEVRTKLTSIEALLLEIRLDQKKNMSEY